MFTHCVYVKNKRSCVYLRIALTTESMDKWLNILPSFHTNASVHHNFTSADGRYTTPGSQTKKILTQNSVKAIRIFTVSSLSSHHIQMSQEESLNRP